ncbi:hypothetical protein ABH930_006387 [Kitasatospora sp. GAS204A]|uniref:hypothetical protein n=1 Tax=unclassified Kitasatospora TaxID=2633591 RepID=UPI002476871E|nr:hypothetical protein [Kitasatospora sp. GAS204B]MDH6122021.1 hypothetical protein [Kitasatospora sp. GAS204B]
MQETDIRADELRVGDTIRWYGRQPTVTRIKSIAANSIEFWATDGWSHVVATDDTLTRLSDGVA